MRFGVKLIVIAVLALLIGVAFASPLLYEQLEIRPFQEPIPKGTPADIRVDVVYANFTVKENSTTTTEIYQYGSPANLTAVSCYVVLNITNYSDELALVDWAQFYAGESVSKGAGLFSLNGTLTTGWEAKGAWLDGEWVNVTWAPGFWAGDKWIEGYWMEGVQIRDTYTNGILAATSMNMNGTWVDVTGRINVTRRENPYSSWTTVTGVLVGVSRSFGMQGVSSEDNEGIDVGPESDIATPEEFNNLWVPHQSRLIVLSANRNILSSIISPSTLEMLKSGRITLYGTVHGRLNGTMMVDTSSIADDIRQVQLGITADGYVYNAILSENQMFTTDQYRVEAFIET